jgi:hypothetical protein
VHRLRKRKIEKQVELGYFAIQPALYKTTASLLETGQVSLPLWLLLCGAGYGAVYGAAVAQSTKTAHPGPTRQQTSSATAAPTICANKIHLHNPTPNLSRSSLATFHCL